VRLSTIVPRVEIYSRRGGYESSSALCRVKQFSKNVNMEWSEFKSNLFIDGRS
jgi:hypothetical protein